MKNHVLVACSSLRGKKRTRSGPCDVRLSKLRLLSDENGVGAQKLPSLSSSSDRLRHLSSNAVIRKNDYCDVVYLGDRCSTAKCAVAPRHSLAVDTGACKPREFRAGAICPTDGVDVVVLDLPVPFVPATASEERMLDYVDPNYQLFLNYLKKNSRPRDVRRETMWEQEMAGVSDKRCKDYEKDFQTSQRAQSELVDECYKKYMTSLIKECKQAIKVDKVSSSFSKERRYRGRAVITTREDVRLSDSDEDVVVLENYSSSKFNYGSWISVDEPEENTRLDWSNSMNHMPYQRKQLSECLNQPYDEYELKTHLELFRRRKCMEGSRELRNGYKTYKLEAEGKSYEDHHPDLGLQIRQTPNKYLHLLLLRGFFFWLKNVGGEEALCPPWKDPFWMKCIKSLSRGGQDKGLCSKSSGTFKATHRGYLVSRA